MVHGGSISTFTKLEPKRIIGSGSFGKFYEAVALNLPSFMNLVRIF
jgi:hypothetical protein